MGQIPMGYPTHMMNTYPGLQNKFEKPKKKKFNKTRAMCHWSATKVHDVTLLTGVLKSEEKQKHTGFLNMVLL